MSVYVDHLRKCVPSKRWPYSHASHLLADSLSELHEFAKRLGLKRSWFQYGSTPHYDLTMSMRAKAIGMGAKQTGNDKELVAFLQELRKSS